MRIRAKICPISGPGLLSLSEIERKSRETIQRSGADTVELFDRCAASMNGTTFRQQAERWMHEAKNRYDDPISPATQAGYSCYLNKWLNPSIGDLPLASVDNLAAKQLVAKLHAAKLARKTIVEIFGCFEQVVASAKDDKTRQPIFRILWDRRWIGVPKIKAKEQRRPTLTSEQVSRVFADSTGRYQALGALLAGTGLRIGEALAIKLDAYSEDHSTITPDCKTIHIRKSVRGTSEQKPKTENARRSIDVCDPLAIFLREHIAGRTSGYLFQSDRGLPLLQSNVLRDWLHKLSVAGFHTFRRFRTSTLRKARVPWDLEKFWIGHANKDVTDKYAEQLQEDVGYRREWAEKVGLGFILGPSNVVQIKGKRAA